MCYMWNLMFMLIGACGWGEVSTGSEILGMSAGLVYIYWLQAVGILHTGVIDLNYMNKESFLHVVIDATY